MKCTFNLGDFCDVDALCIINIPIPQIEIEDMMTWSGKPTVEYSIQSGYKELQRLCFESNNPNRPIYKHFYKALWGTRVPPKVKTINWRFFNNDIPSYHNLQIKRLKNTAICPRCEADVETNGHIIHDCPKRNQNWDALGLNRPAGEDNEDIRSWFMSLFEIINNSNR
ncbi:hypothetical protein J1N35_008410 [Gossypium stocksii]|uniref:Reverse transcriptase zinc-binding domain-containing protein n=1 Tax=Gossypium stocksii TaxID=47602 RepID=A0A9D4AEF2_9ROSI|nr:hypothetical protein J1N35_008410 [Gossypium stocksii]